MRVPLPAFRSLLTAAGLLLAGVAGIELWLRLADDRTARPADLADAGGLIERSRTVHHRLCPLRTVMVANPDDGEPVEVAINSHGLRGPEVVVPKPPGVFRILCLGDETVLGPMLPEAQTLPARLGQLLQARTRLRVEVLNGGVPDDCPLLSSLRLRHSLLALQPDLILLHVDMSDVADDQRYRRFTRVDEAGVPYACAHPFFDRRAEPLPWWADLKLTALAARRLDRSTQADPAVAATADIDDPHAGTAWLRDNPPDWSVYVEQTLAPVEEVRRLADGTYAAFLLATCPQPWQIAPDASRGPGVWEAAGVPAGSAYTSRGPFEAIKRFATDRGIACCDASPSFRDDDRPSRLFQRNTAQLSALGQELYAREIGQYITERLPAFGSGGPPSGVPASPGMPEYPAAADEGPYYR